MFLMPFRVKNPIKRFPYATVALLAANVTFFALTSRNFQEITDSYFKHYAFALGISAWWKFFTAIFLQKDLAQLGINMLFLWVFGAPVEDRVRIPRFLLIYILSGLAAAFFQAGLDAAYTGDFRLWVGSTGPVMGIVGAYWLLYAWSSVSVFYWFVIWYGVVDVAAFWVVGMYLLLDLLQGVIHSSFGVLGGITNISHVGAGAVAVLLCMAMRVKRDSQGMSEAKALLADESDLSNMPVYALQTLLEGDPYNAKLIRAMLPTAFRSKQTEPIERALLKGGPKVINKDPRLVAEYLLNLYGNPNIYRPVHLLRLAGLLEREGEAHRAMSVYRIIVDRFPDRVEAETALYRMALCSWGTLKDPSAARTYLDELEWRFPEGEMSEFGRSLLGKINAASHD